MKPQKAKHKYLEDEKKKQNYQGFSYLMLPKLDGWYGYFDIHADNNVRSNAQRVIPSCADRTRGLVSKINDTDHFDQGRLIFELTVDGTPQFETMNGIMNRKAVCPDIRLNVHDFIPFRDQGMLTFDRYLLAEEVVHHLDLDWVDMIPHYGVSDVPTFWESKAMQLIDDHWEGLILKNMQAGYTPGIRNADLMKIKEECEFDLLCVGLQKGKPDGKYRNTLGALVLQDKAGNKFTVSGMTDTQRAIWWGNPAAIVHKVVKIKGKNVMKDGSIREPRFNVIRYDKNKDDIDTVEPKRKKK